MHASVRCVGLGLLAFLMAGCASAGEGPRFTLSGSFAPGYTQADIDEVEGIVDDYTDDGLVLMESEPPQFRVTGIVGGCEQLRSTLQAKGYIASVGACNHE